MTNSHQQYQYLTSADPVLLFKSGRATKTPISSAPFVSRAEQARRWLCLMPTLSPCGFTSMRYPAMSRRRARRPATRSRRLAYDGQAPHAEQHHADLPCHRARRNSIRSRTSGNTSAATGSPTACSKLTTPSLTPHVRLGESSSLSRRQSPQSACAIGRTSVDPNDRWYNTLSDANARRLTWRRSGSS
jgi:hypothetical protein